MSRQIVYFPTVKLFGEFLGPMPNTPAFGGHLCFRQARPRMKFLPVRTENKVPLTGLLRSSYWVTGQNANEKKTRPKAPGFSSLFRETGQGPPLPHTCTAWSTRSLRLSDTRSGWAATFPSKQHGNTSMITKKNLTEIAP